MSVRVKLALPCKGAVECVQRVDNLVANTGWGSFYQLENITKCFYVAQRDTLLFESNPGNLKSSGTAFSN